MCKVVIDSTHPKQGDRGEVKILIEKNFQEFRSHIKNIQNENIFLWWYRAEYLEGNWRARWMTYFLRNNRVWSMNPSPASGAGIGNLKSKPDIPYETKGVGITSGQENSTINASLTIGQKSNETEASYKIYQFQNSSQIKLLDEQVSRAIIRRQLRILPDRKLDATVWYPIWNSGSQGSASLISMKILPDQTIFRYDQWGYPMELIPFNSQCNPIKQSIFLTVNNESHSFSVKCGNELKQVKIPEIKSQLARTDLLGINIITPLLGGSERLEPKFPGTITEIKMH